MTHFSLVDAQKCLEPATSRYLPSRRVTSNENLVYPWSALNLILLIPSHIPVRLAALGTRRAEVPALNSKPHRRRYSLEDALNLEQICLYRSPS